MGTKPLGFGICGFERFEMCVLLKIDEHKAVLKDYKGGSENYRLPLPVTLGSATKKRPKLTIWEKRLQSEFYFQEPCHNLNALFTLHNVNSCP